MKKKAGDNLHFVKGSDHGTSHDDLSDSEKGILDWINQKIAGVQTLDEAMTFLFESMQRVCLCDRTGLAFLSPEGERMELHWVHAAYAPLRLGVGYAQNLKGSSLERVIREGTPRIINDLPQYLAEHPASDPTRLLVDEGVRSSITCPLRVDERIVGVMFLSARQPHAYDAHHVRLHQAVIERVSQTVEKAYRIEQLTAANKAYMEMLGFVSHELKSPLAGMLMNIEILRRGYVGGLAPEQKDKVEVLLRQGNYLLGLIREYLDLARIEGGDLKLKLEQGIDIVAEVIEPALGIVQAEFQGTMIRWIKEAPEKGAKCDCDPELMRIVTVNLLNNAAKYGNQDGTIRLKVTQDEGRVIVAVRNEGLGFKQSDRQRLFKKFSRLSTHEFAGIKGTGVGLYISWRIINLHNGRIGAESEYGKWAEFAYEIPLHHVEDSGRSPMQSP